MSHFQHSKITLRNLGLLWPTSPHILFLLLPSPYTSSPNCYIQATYSTPLYALNVKYKYKYDYCTSLQFNTPLVYNSVQLTNK